MRLKLQLLGSIGATLPFVGAVAVAACAGSDATPTGVGGSAGLGTTVAGQGGAVGLAGTTGSGGAGATGSAGMNAAGTGGGAGGSGGTSGTVGTGGGPGGGGTGAVGGGGAGAAGAPGGGAGTGGGAGGSAGGSLGGSSGAGGSMSGAGGSTSGAPNAGSGGSGGSAGGSTGVGCMPPTAYPNLFVTVSGHTQAESDTKVADAWSKMFTAGASGAIYFNGPASDESYVEDLYNGDVRSEGMSYGMMVAVQLDHQTEFDRLWTWVKHYMAQGTTGQQIAWSVTPQGSKKSNGGAPDGDEYFAAALIFAHTRWGDAGKFDYATEAHWVLDLLRTKEFNQSAHIVQFVAGSSNTDGSYVLPAFYQTWACFDTANADFWNAAVTSGREFFHNAIDSNGVIGDQSSFTGQTTKGAGADTIRCVANIMMDHNFFNADPWQTETYATKYGAYESTRGNGVAQQSCNALLGFGLPASSGKPFVDKLWSTSVPNRNYWDGVLYMLAMLHVSGNFRLWY